MPSEWRHLSMCSRIRSHLILRLVDAASLRYQHKHDIHPYSDVEHKVMLWDWASISLERCPNSCIYRMLAWKLGKDHPREVASPTSTVDCYGEWIVGRGSPTAMM